MHFVRQPSRISSRHDHDSRERKRGSKVRFLADQFEGLPIESLYRFASTRPMTLSLSWGCPMRSRNKGSTSRANQSRESAFGDRSSGTAPRKTNPSRSVERRLGGLIIQCMTQKTYVVNTVFA